MIAVIRIRGSIKTRKDIKDTLKMIRLKTVNNCVVLPENETYKGMIQKAKDFITWGEINKETFKKMLLKWGRINGNKKISEKYLKEKNYDVDKFITLFFEKKLKLQDVGINPVFRFHPPRKGYEGVKKPFTLKGSLGYRGEKINDLLGRMI